MKKRTAFLLLTFCFGGCSSLNLDKTPQSVFIDSNVTAWVYDGKRRLGETPFFGKIDRSLFTDVTLQKSGYKTVKVPLKRRAQRKMHGLSETENALAATSFYGTLLGLPALTDITGTTAGYWVEYMPNSYYVELEPENGSHADANAARKREIKTFALKNFPAVAAKDPEYLKTLSAVTGRDEGRLSALVDAAPDPVAFAEAAARLSTER